jgi:hypothetical protein
VQLGRNFDTRLSVSDIDYGGLGVFLRICSIRKVYLPLQNHVSNIRKRFLKSCSSFKPSFDDVFFTLGVAVLKQEGNFGKMRF